MYSESRSSEKTFTCLLSHPNKCLKEHLKGVGEIVKKVFPLKDEKLQELASLTARFHDLGKATSYFQDYIRQITVGEAREISQNSEELKRHAFLSAVFLFYYTKEKEPPF